jgi:hypothetical protein
MYSAEFIDSPPQYSANINICNTGLGATPAAITGVASQDLRKETEFFVETVAQSLGSQRPRIAATGSACKPGIQAGVPQLAARRYAILVFTIGQQEAMAGAADEVTGAAFNAILGEFIPKA